MPNYKWVSTSGNPCPSCAALDGQIHSEEDWAEFGVDPGNERLYCKEACSCTMEETDEDETGDLKTVPLRHEENSSAPSATSTSPLLTRAKETAMKKIRPILRSMPITHKLDLPKRAEIMPQIESGELDHIDFTARTFRAGKNKNHYVFQDKDLELFAKSFEGQPFLRNHDTYDIGARDGTITDSTLEGQEFKQTIRLTTRRGMLDFVEGRIDRFSIGWFYDDVLCSICNQTWFSSACYHWPGKTYEVGEGKTKKQCELIFVNPKGKETSAVNTPAVDGTGIESLTEYKLEVFGEVTAVTHARRASKSKLLKGVPMKKKVTTQADVLEEDTQELSEQERAALELQGANEVMVELQEQQRQQTAIHIANLRSLLENSLMTSKLPAASQKAVRKPFELLLNEGKTFLPTQLEEAIKDKRDELASLNENIQGPARAGSVFGGMFNSADQIKAALADLLGAPRDEGLEKLRIRPLSGIREAYVLMTGDVSFMGGYYPEYSLVQANFPGTVSDLLNKILIKAWDDSANVYGWWEAIVTVEHFNNLQDPKWIRTGTIASLPAVLERGEYTELPIGDNKESSDWGKYGGYVPLTIESVINDDVRAFRRMPRELALAGRRNISEQVAAIFTQNSAAGPTMADGGALFNATAQTTAGGHLNLLTTALGTDYVAWSAVATAMFKKKMLVKNAAGYYGTGKPYGVRPKYCLVPADLADQAFALFVPRLASVLTTAGIPTKGQPNYGGAVEPIVVPEWTDATDWASAADPLITPGVMLGEIFGLKPQIFSASSEIDPAMFANDESRIKVRQFVTVGVADDLPLSKNNVA